MVDAAFDADVARAQAIYDTLGEWINRYHGGVPTGFVASAILHESGGNFGAPGDASLGEIGYLQVAAYVPPLFGYPPEARMDPESNIAIGVLEYELEAVLWSLAYPEVTLGTDDNWKLARLAFSVGRAGSHQLADMARASGGLEDGAVYNSIVRATLANGGVALGSQSATKVYQRVIDIDRQWAIGQAVGGMSGPPMIIPDPPAGPYSLPAEVEPYFVSPLPISVLLLGAAAFLAYLIWRR
jgi:hypothetical protein